jgi:hypothetical protein
MGGRSGGRKASDQVMLTAKQLFERYSPDHDDASPAQADRPGVAPGHQAHRHLLRAGTAQHRRRLPHQPGRRLPLGACGRLAHLLLPWRRAGQAHHGPFLRADAGRPRRAHRGRGQRPPAVQHPHGMPGRRGRSAGRPELHPQLQPGDVLMACSDGVWHYFSPNELGSVLSSLSPREASEFLIEKARSRGAWRRRQPVAGHRQARAAGRPDGPPPPQGGTGSGRGGLPDCAARCSTLARCSRASSRRAARSAAGSRQCPGRLRCGPLRCPRAAPRLGPTMQPAPPSGAFGSRWSRRPAPPGPWHGALAAHSRCWLPCPPARAGVRPCAACAPGRSGRSPAGAGRTSPRAAWPWPSRCSR